MYDLMIIGGGPAGMTAAIYAARRNMKTILIEGKIFGGEIATTPSVENWPGEKSISGIDLANKIKEHMNVYDIKVEIGDAENIEKTGDGFKVNIDGKEIESKTILFATGTKYRSLKVAGEEKLMSKGVSFCATCDGPLFQNEDVAVIGGGNSAISSAIVLKDIASKVYIITHSEKLKAEEKKVEKCSKNEKVEILYNKDVVEITGEGKVEGIKLKDNKTSEETDLKVQGVFVNIGMLPNNKLANQLGIELSENGYIEVDRNTMKTSINGVFAAGDITAGGVAQAITAAGEGALAAISAHEFLQK